MQKLAQIKHPIGAVATCRQLFSTQPTPSPRGVRFTHGIVANRTVMLPTDATALTLKQMLDGYLSCRTVMFSHRTGDAMSLYKGETLELQHAFDGKLPADGSLPPRHVAVTLLYYGECGATSSKTYLDALAHLASTPVGIENKTLGANIMRMTVLAEFEADWYARNVGRESVSSAPATADGDVQLAVRWCTGTAMHTEFGTMPCGVSLITALQTMQNFMIALKVQYRAPISDNLCVSRDNVAGDSWLISMHNATRSFANLMEGTPHVSKCDFLKRFPEIDIDDVGVFVRISERARGAAGINDPSAFHGFLVGNSAHIDDIRKHCASYRELPPPDEDTIKFCLHTCAVQTQTLQLGTRVSLYAQGGACGQSFSSSGNWLYRLDPAIVPLEAVLEHFIVTPCTRESTIPGDGRLALPNNKYINRAYALFCSTFGTTQSSVVHGAEYERRPLCPVLSSVNSESLDDRYARTAFGVDMTSRRIMVGDAYNLLAAQNAPKQLTDFLLQSTLRFGVETSLLGSLEKAAESLMAFTTKAQQECKDRDLERYKRVDEGAVLVRSKRARVEPNRSNGHPTAQQPVQPLRSKHMNHLMSIAGISKYVSNASIPTKDADAADFGAAATLLAQAVLPDASLSSAIIEAASATAKTAREFGAMNMVAAAVTMLKTDRSAYNATVFLMHAVEGDEKVNIYEVFKDGNIVTSSPGKLLETAERRVFVVRETGNGVAQLKVCEY